MTNEKQIAIEKTKQENIRLGDILVHQGVISSDQLQKSLLIQKHNGRRLGEILIESGFITDVLLANTLARQLKIPFVNLKTFPYKLSFVKILSESLARKFRVLSLEDKGDSLLLAFANPLDIYAFDELSRILKRRLTIAVAAESQFNEAWDALYNNIDKSGNYAKIINPDKSNVDTINTSPIISNNDIKEVNDSTQNQITTDKSSVSQEIILIHSILEQALKVNASEVHIEPKMDFFHIRFRINGFLHYHNNIDKNLYPDFVNNLKSIFTTGRNDDFNQYTKKINLISDHPNINIRLSLLPTQYGQSCALRFLNTNLYSNFDEINFIGENIEQLNYIISCNKGLILIAGPAHCGKTTTLNIILSKLKIESLKVISIENSSETLNDNLYNNITQTKFNSKNENGFNNTFNNVLLQYPDIVLVGNINNKDITQNIIDATSSGYMIISTIEANNTIDVILKLLDMGFSSFKINTSLRAIISQKLIRLNCKNCNQEYIPNNFERNWLNKYTNDSDLLMLKSGCGCHSCSGTGYFGSKSVFEILEINPIIMQALQLNSNSFIIEAKKQMNKKTIFWNIINLIITGQTSVKEGLRVTSSFDELIG